jgi:hypothetical protein
MEETQKLIEEIYTIAQHITSMTKYEKYDIAIKMLALQEQRKANQLLKNIDDSIIEMQTIL